MVDEKGPDSNPSTGPRCCPPRRWGTCCPWRVPSSPSSIPLILLLADTGCRIGEALALRWSDVDLVTGIVRIERSVDHAGRLGLTKTRRGRVVELSTRLREVSDLLRSWIICPDEALMFPSKAGGSHALRQLP